MDDWAVDLKRSARIFRSVVWSEMSKAFPGVLEHVEATTRPDVANYLDMLAGIDAWRIVAGTGMQGIASRVQQCPSHYQPYNTFTIRRSRDSGAMTEYEKRKRAIESGEWIYPHLTVQAYVTEWDDPELRSFAVARTTDLIRVIDEWERQMQPSNVLVSVNRTGNASFYVVEWDLDVCQFIYPEGAVSQRWEKLAARPVLQQEMFDVL